MKYLAADPKKKKEGNPDATLSRREQLIANVIPSTGESNKKRTREESSEDQIDLTQNSDSDLEIEVARSPRRIRTSPVTEKLFGELEKGNNKRKAQQKKRNTRATPKDRKKRTQHQRKPITEAPETPIQGTRQTTFIPEVEIVTQYGLVTLTIHSIQSYPNGLQIPVYNSICGLWAIGPDGNFSLLPQELSAHLMDL